MLQNRAGFDEFEPSLLPKRMPDKGDCTLFNTPADAVNRAAMTSV